MITPTTKKKKSLYVTPLGVLISFIVLYTIMPIWSQLISDYLSTYLYMTLLLIVLVGLVLTDGANTMIRYIVLLLPLAIYHFLFLIVTDWIEPILWGYNALVACLPLIFGFYLCFVKKKLLKFESRVLLVAFAVTIVTTIVGLIRYPSASRMLATKAMEDSPLLRTFNLNNIGGYDFIYYLVLLYPILIYAYKHKKIKLLPTILLSLMIFFCIIQSEYTLALLFFAITTVLFFVKQKFKVKNLFVLILISTVLILVFWTQFSRLLVWVSQYIESADIRERILAIAGGRQGLDAMDDKRIALYQRSIDTFLKVPLLGALTPGIDDSLVSGGHSQILDTFANYGIVGAVVLFLIYKKTYNLFYRPFNKDEDYGFVFWCYLQTILLSLLNPGIWEFYLMFAAPVLIRLVRGEEPEAQASAAPSAVQEAPNAEPLQSPEQSS